MSEDKVPYKSNRRPQSKDANIKLYEQRLFDTAQKILLINLADEKYIKGITTVAQETAKMPQHELDECFGYHVDKDQLANEIIISFAINTAKQFMRRYQQLK